MSAQEMADDLHSVVARRLRVIDQRYKPVIDALYADADYTAEYAGVPRVTGGA